MPADPVAFINDRELVVLTQQLVRIPSEYMGSERVEHGAIADCPQEHMAAASLALTVIEPVPEYPCVIGCLRGTGGGPTVGFIGHCSTVAVGEVGEWDNDPFGAEVVDGRLYGRGAADEQGVIAATLEAVRAIKESGQTLRGDIEPGTQDD